jgi:hypothetical protein
MSFVGRVAKRQAYLNFLLGDANGTIRIPLSDWVIGRVPEYNNEVMLAQLPRSIVSNSQVLLEDSLMPIAGYNLKAYWISTRFGLGMLEIDISSLPQ